MLAKRAELDKILVSFNIMSLDSLGTFNCNHSTHGKKKKVGDAFFWPSHLGKEEQVGGLERED